MENLGIGIVAGVITGLLMLFFRQVWLKILEPKLADYLYRDVRIDGIWKSELTTRAGSPYEEEIEVCQKGHKLYGTISHFAL